MHVAKVVLKLLPIVINLRHDRREWVKHEGKNVEEEKYRKHARKVLKTFIELGPSYIKLGQWLSTRVDILPQPYLEVLSKLQDDVPPALFSEVKPIIENELGKIEDAFLKSLTLLRCLAQALDRSTWQSMLARRS